MRRNRLLLLGVLGLILVGLGWWYFQFKAAGAPLPSHVLVANAPAYSIEVAPAQSSISVNDTVRLNFTARKDGVVHDIYGEHKIVHYVIASANYLDFYHTFTPEVKGSGTFYIDHTFTQPGEYRIWTELVDTATSKDIHHGEHAALISYSDLTVAGGQATTAIVPVPAATASVGPYRVVSNHTPITAGTPATIAWHVEDQQGNVLPVLAEEPAIYVMVGPTFSFFRHTHTQPAIKGNSIELTETFPTPGKYLLWTETYVKNGETYDSVQVPFLLTVR